MKLHYRWARVALFITVFVSASTVPAWAADYTITGLGTLGASASYANGINNLGQVVGDLYNSDGTYRAFLYSSGTMTDIGTLGGSQGYATAINNSGQVSGWASTPSVFQHAFFYSNGSMTDLGTLGGNYSSAGAINNNGETVGASNPVQNSISRAFLYSNGTMTNLGTLGAPATAGNSVATGINDSSQIVGFAATADYYNHAFLYSNGSMTDLGTLGGTSSSALGINSFGQVVGSSYITNPPFGYQYQHAFLYNNGSMMDLGTLGGTNSDSFARGINIYGQVVGDSGGRAFVYNNGVMTDLNSLIAANSGWTLYQASAINDSGQIVGYGSVNGYNEAFLLTPNMSPVPIPGALWLLGSGLLGLLGVARRGR